MLILDLRDVRIFRIRVRGYLLPARRLDPRASDREGDVQDPDVVMVDVVLAAKIPTISTKNAPTDRTLRFAIGL